MSKGQQVDLTRLPPLSCSSSCKYVYINIDKEYFQKYRRHMSTNIASWIVILQLSEIRRMSVEHMTRLMRYFLKLSRILIFLRFSKLFHQIVKMEMAHKVDLGKHVAIADICFH